MRGAGFLRRGFLRWFGGRLLLGRGRRLLPAATAAATATVPTTGGGAKMAAAAAAAAATAATAAATTTGDVMGRSGLRTVRGLRGRRFVRLGSYRYPGHV